MNRDQAIRQVTLAPSVDDVLNIRDIVNDAAAAAADRVTERNVHAVLYALTTYAYHIAADQMPEEQARRWDDDPLRWKQQRYC